MTEHKEQKQLVEYVVYNPKLNELVIVKGPKSMLKNVKEPIAVCLCVEGIPLTMFDPLYCVGVF